MRISSTDSNNPIIKIAGFAAAVVVGFIAYSAAEKLGAGQYAFFWAMPFAFFAVISTMLQFHPNSHSFNKTKIFYRGVLPLLTIPILLQIGWGIYSFIPSFIFFYGADFLAKRKKNKGVQS